MSRMKGKVVIVTGSAQGMGEAELRLMADEGAKVVGADLNIAALQKVVDEINVKCGEGSAIAIKLDVANKADWESVIETTISTFGKIDALVNNAGYLNKGGYMNIQDITEKEWNLTMSVNAHGNFLGIQAVMPQMKKQNKGSIVNISSISGIVGGQDGVQYTASKGANRLIAKGAAVELGKYNIRVNSIHPGYINTAMAATVFNDDEENNGSGFEKDEVLGETIPLARMAEPIEVAYGALFLASDESSYVSGCELIIDGGLTAK